MQTINPAKVTNLSITSKNLASGVVTPLGSYPSRRQQVTHGAIIRGDRHNPCPWSWYVEDTKPFTGRAFDKQGNYGGPPQPWNSQFEGPLQGMLSPNLSAKSRASMVYNKTLDELAEKVRGSLDLSVAMAEASSTVSMVRALGSWRRWFSGFGSRRWANEWLQYQYGWKPLLSDIYNAADEMINTNAGMSHVKARSSSTNAAAEVLSTPGGIDVTGLSHYTAFPVKSNSKFRVFDSCEIKVWLAPPDNIQNLSRWTSLNPLSIAWELTPYSFVVDWFVDIGSYIRNLETAFLYNNSFRGGYISKLFVGSQNSTVAYRDSVEPYFGRVIWIDAKSEGLVKSFSRELLTSYPLPRVPQVNTDLSSTRLLSAAALLRQQLGR